MEQHTTYGVFIANTGTPDEPEPDAVRVYLKRFLSHPRIRPMNNPLWDFILNAFILPKRGIASAEKYRTIWTDEGSPFSIEHAKLQNNLEGYLDRRLKGDGCSAIIRQAMSFGAPLIRDAVAELRDLGCDRLIVLPLYPQSAHSTTLAVKDDVEKTLNEIGWSVPCDFVDNYHDDAAYIEALADTVRAAGFDASPESKDLLLMSYHSIPVRDIEAGDTYDKQTRKTSELIAETLGLRDDAWTIGYQCRFDKSRSWLEPFTKDVLAKLADDGVGSREGRDDAGERGEREGGCERGGNGGGGGRLFYMCPNFAVDCLETLYDIDHELKPFYLEKAEAAGHPVSDDGFRYVPCLNSSDAHVAALAGVIMKHLG